MGSTADEEQEASASSLDGDNTFLCGHFFLGEGGVSSAKSAPQSREGGGQPALRPW